MSRIYLTNRYEIRGTLIALFKSLLKKFQASDQNGHPPPLLEGCVYVRFQSSGQAWRRLAFAGVIFASRVGLPRNEIKLL